MTDGQLPSPEDMHEFEQDAKIAILATINPDGMPHLSLITSLQAKDTRHLMFGQFSEGRSKKNVRSNPNVAFAVLSRDKHLWRGKARWTHADASGDDYEMYNRKPMFRYNSYFGIHTVHYLDLVEFRGRERLPLAGIAAGSLATAIGRRLVPIHYRLARGTEPLFDLRQRPGKVMKTRSWHPRPQATEILKPWAQRHINHTTTLKFFGYVGSDGYPAIAPVVPCRAVDTGRLVFAFAGLGKELTNVAAGAPVAMLAINLQMESVLVRGTLRHGGALGALKLGALDIAWVYNSMPPLQGPIYPVPSLTAATV
jgi:uncharacterized pyridoxamine 5'-phosphate oxidase family protein